MQGATAITTKPSTFSAVVKAANPVFIAVAMGIPIVGLLYAIYFGTLSTLHYVHIMTGAFWTGTDLFMGLILGPVLGGLDPQDRAKIFRRLVPKMTFMMPAVATVTITAGIKESQHMGIFALGNTWVLVALIIALLLTAQGFGLLLPNEIRIYRQLLSDRPDVNRIAKLGMLNAKLGGLQGLFQLGIIFAMAHIRF